MKRRPDGRYIVPPTYEPLVDAFCVVLVIAFLLYLGGHVLWSVVR
jgi:hypothetical protein